MDNEKRSTIDSDFIADNSQKNFGEFSEIQRGVQTPGGFENTAHAVNTAERLFLGYDGCRHRRCYTIGISIIGKIPGRTPHLANERIARYRNEGSVPEFPKSMIRRAPCPIFKALAIARVTHSLLFSTAPSTESPCASR